MAAFQQVGDFQLNTTPGNLSISGLGFQPKLILFFHTPDTVDIGTQTANFNMSYGSTDGVNQFATCTFSPNGNSGTQTAYSVQTTTDCIVGSINNAGVWRASIVSMDADGFTINQPAGGVPGVNVRVGYLALGGPSMVNYQAGYFAAGTGLQAVNTGFQPTGLIMYSIGTTAFTSNPTNLINQETYPGFGFSDGTNSRAHGQWLRSTFVSVKARGRVGRNDAIMAAPNLVSPSTTYAYLLGLNSFDASGFTVNNAVAGLNKIMFYLAFDGAQTAVGNITSPTGTGAFSISGLAFNPASIVMASSWQNAYGVFGGCGQVANGPGAMLSTGFATSGIDQLAIGATTIDFTVTSIEAHHSDSTHIMRRFSTNPFTTLEMDFATTALSAGQIDFNCTTASGTTSVISYIAIEGSTSPTPSDPTGGSGDPNSPDSSFLFNMIGV